MIIQLLFGFVSLSLMAEAAKVHQTLIIDTIFPYQTSNKPILSANYSFPGPPIEVYEGDTLVIRVINRLNAPTTIHWHGIYQTYTPGMDGAVGVSQCAIPPRGEMTYNFTATPAGTTWYHGHVLEQYTDGLYGPLIIRQRNEPNQDKYDTEHILTVADWYNKPAHSELHPLHLNPNNSAGVEPEPDAIVVNGKFTQSLFISLSGSTRVRFRIINAAALSMYNVSIDGLPLHIIELDQMDTLPYSVNSFAINVAQRVSFYIDLNELDSSYSASGASATKSVFIRFQAMLPMYPVDIVNYIQPYEKQRYPYPTFFNPLYLAILSLDGTNSIPAYPASQPTPTLPNTVTPVETNILDARPINTGTGEVPNATYCLSLIITFSTSTNGINYAYLNNVTYSSDANYMHMRPDPTHGITSDLYAPLLHQMATKPNGLGIPPPRIEAGSELPTLQSDGYGHFLVPYQAVVDIYLNNTDNAEHPFHLHGHKFWIIATSDYPQAEYLYAGDYIQRDTISVPRSGWAKIRFVANKPGAWFFHCHIEWHMSAGLALAFIVSPQQLLREGYRVPKDQKDLCQALREFNKKHGTNN
jgi:iron transport multicopper oxidase